MLGNCINMLILMEVVYLRKIVRLKKKKPTSRMLKTFRSESHAEITTFPNSLWTAFSVSLCVF